MPQTDPEDQPQAAPRAAQAESPWRTRIVDVGRADPHELAANPRNWRRHPRSQANAVAGVLDQVGWVQDVIVNRTTNLILDGHLRVELARRRGEKEVPVKYVELSEEEEALVLATYDPLGALAVADTDRLSQLAEDARKLRVSPQLEGLLAALPSFYTPPGGNAAPQEDVSPRTQEGEAAQWPEGGGLDEYRARGQGYVDTEGNWQPSAPQHGEAPDYDAYPDIEHTTLVDRFVAPPWTLLDARQGYWLKRKRAWLSLGIESELGREDGLIFTPSAQGPAHYELRNKMRAALGRDPSWEEVLAEAERRGMTALKGTSVFDPVLCELMYRWFSPPGGAVLDPFAGGSVRGVVAAALGRDYTGIDLSERQVEANREQWAAIEPRVAAIAASRPEPTEAEPAGEVEGADEEDDAEGEEEEDDVE